MQAGDERYERLKHQTRFLHARGLVSPEMEESQRQLWLLERLSGKDARGLDPQVVDRIHRDLDAAVIEQLRTTGLMQEWLESWEARDEATAAPTREIPCASVSPIQLEATAVDGPPEQAGDDLQNRAERNLRLLAELHARRSPS